MTKSLRAIILTGIFAIPFIPFIVSSSMFFPFITGKNFAFRIVVEIIFAAWLILMLYEPMYRPRFTKITITVLSLLGILTLATIFGANPYRSFWSNYERMDGLISHLHLAAYFLVLSSMLTTRDLWRRFLQTWVGASALMTIYVIAQTLGTFAINQGGVRVDGTMGNATYLAVYALFNIFLAAYLAITAKINWQRYAYGLIGLGNLFMLYKTGTRGTMLGLLGGVLLGGVLLVWRGRGRLRQAAFGAVAVVILIVILFLGLRHTNFVQNSPVLSRFAAISSTDTTTESRFLIWRMSIKGVAEHPILGWGPENYNLVFDKYYNPKLWRQEPWFDRSHNVFFDWAITTGLLGLAVYLSLFGWTIFSLWRSKEDVVIKSLLTGLLAGYFVHNIFVFDNLISYVLFFSVLAWVGVVFVENEPESKNKKSFQWSEAVQAARPILVGVILVGGLAVLYFFNIKPIKASRGLIRALTPSQNVQINLEHFKKVLALQTFGSSEAREQLLTASVAVASLPEVDLTLKQEWVALAGEEMDKAIAIGRQNDARSNLLFSGFLYRLGVVNPALYDRALHQLSLASQFSPTKQSIMIQTSNVYLSRDQVGDRDRAFDFAKQAFDLDPAYPEARRNYMAVAAYLGREDLVKELAAGANDPLIWNDQRLISVYANNGQYGRVLEIWQGLVKAEPANFEFQINLARAYVLVGRFGEAVLVLKQAKVLVANDPNVIKELDVILADLVAGRRPAGW